jgi:hypothetical protein
MVKGQQNDTTILLGLKGYKGGEERLREHRNALIAAQVSPTHMVSISWGKYSIPGAMAEVFILRFTAAAGSVGRDCKRTFAGGKELVHTVTEVRQRKVLGILRDDRIATLKKFLLEVISTPFGKEPISSWHKQSW